MQILSLMKLADIFTVGNLCCGILSILLVIDGHYGFKVVAKNNFPKSVYLRDSTIIPMREDAGRIKYA
ncbi:MAG: hypothetical protein WAW61_07620 [Methylococcaceae bacterium]